MSTINMVCPRCDLVVYVQVGDGKSYTTYNSHEVPKTTAELAKGEEAYCDDCGITFTVVEILRPLTVALGLAKW